MTTHNTTIQILNHGFVRLVEHMGNDESIVQAARISHGEGLKTAREDKALIDYLMRHSHTSPFEHVIFKFHIKMPIFVARQWVRHRTASLNEISGRYSELKNEYYIPTKDRFIKQSTTNKQCSKEEEFISLEDLKKSVWKIMGEEINDWTVEELLERDFEATAEDAFTSYRNYLEIGLNRETARIGLPLSTYTEFYWTCDLHNILHLLKLRLSSHAQYEIKQYAQAIADLIQIWVPFTWESFSKHILNGTSLAEDEFNIVLSLLKENCSDIKKTVEELPTFRTMSNSRKRELLEKLKIDENT